MDDQQKNGKKRELLKAEHVNKVFGEKADKKAILKDMNVTINEGEFVCFLGPSGSGKSTFLRVLAGLIPPSSGHVFMQGNELQGVNQEVSIVFQNFALYPWLTIRKNIEIGLLSSSLSESQKEERITNAIHIIGLKGFEEAYPKEISGGMKQRVGFARALVVQPTILMMDEPFSALDVLTAESLRHELLSLWLDKKVPTSTILMVTHNIDEAVSMADRLFILSSNPGQIRVELPGIPQEIRKQKGPEHMELVDTIYRIMTNPKKNPQVFISGAEHTILPQEESPYQILPQVSITKLKAFIKKLMIRGGEESLRELSTGISIDDLLPVTEIIDMLGLGGIEGNKMLLTELGKEYATGTIEKEKEIIRKQLLSNVSLIQFITKTLHEKNTHTLHIQEILDHLSQYFSKEDSQIQLKEALILGAYADIFIYNHIRGILTSIES